MTKAPVKTKALDASVIGSTGLRQFGGFISEEFLPELQGLKGARVYREMADNDPIVGAVVFAISTLIRQAEWTVQAVDDTPEGEAGKLFVEEVMGDMSVPWSTVIDEACTMFVYGFAPLEIIYKRRVGPDGEDGSTRSRYTDGRIGIRDISLRAQTTVVRWELDPEDGSINGMWQQPWAGPQVLIPIEKMLLFRTTEARKNPEGRSILRSAYRPYFFKKKLEEIEAIGVERDLAGLPVARIPSRYFAADADPSEKAMFASFQKLVTSIRRDAREGVVMPSDRDASGNLLFDISLMNSGSTRQFDTTKIIDRKDRSIATSVLADFIFLGQQAVGSFALSSDKTALFATAVGAFAGAIADVFNRHLLTRLWRLNGMDPTTMPAIKCADLEHQSLAEVAAMLTAMTSAGAPLFPDRELENALRGMAGLPPAPEESADGTEDAEDPANIGFDEEQDE